MEVIFLEYGSTIREIIVPDRNGKSKCFLRFDNLNDYVEKAHISDVLQAGMLTA